MTCIILYDGLRKYDVTAKILEKVLLAQKLNDKNDKHKPQCKQIPADALTTSYFHMESILQEYCQDH